MIFCIIFAIRAVLSNVRHEKPEKDVKNVIVGMVFSVIYLSVASYFYAQLTSLENEFGENCTLNHTENLDMKLQHYCEHFISWKLCAIIGIVVPGVMYLVLGCVTVCVVTNENIVRYRRVLCHRIWETYDIFLTKVVSVSIFFVLVLSDAHHFVTGNTATFNTAALIYLILVGIETVLWFLALGGFCTIVIFVCFMVAVSPRRCGN